MDTILQIIISKIGTCLTGITPVSNNDSDAKVGETVEHLARAYSYLYQIKESEKNK